MYSKTRETIIQSAILPRNMTALAKKWNTKQFVIRTNFLHPPALVYLASYLTNPIPLALAKGGSALSSYHALLEILTLHIDEEIVIIEGNAIIMFENIGCGVEYILFGFCNKSVGHSCLAVEQVHELLIPGQQVKGWKVWDTLEAKGVETDIIPIIADLLMAIADCSTNLADLLVSIAAGNLINKQSSIAQWRKLFFIAAAGYIFCDTFFNIFKSISRQAWDNPENHNANSHNETEHRCSNIPITPASPGKSH
uniref:Uncharacterized protein n=1 Tax=Glossina pallidipes TaxID=7398 RepID=A0A1A9ZXC5_GLOPL